MKWSIGWLCVGVATVVGMLCIPRIAAASGSMGASGGRITFEGTIVEATCAASAASIGADALMPSSSIATPHRFACNSARTSADSGRFYSLTVVNLDAATINHDRVLDYFAGYMKAAGNEATARLVTQTFE
ncbi:hypothetical protein [Rhodanobacter koreensis]